MKKVIRFAAKELARYGKRMAGDAFEGIRLDVDPSIAEQGMNVELDDLYMIDVRGGKGRICGVNERSVLQGVYRFLRECGCVFVRPGARGDVVPRRSSAECSVTLRCRPYYRFRTITIEGANSLTDALDLIDWAAKNGFNSYFTQFRNSNTFFERYYGHERNEFAQGFALKNCEAAAFVRQIAYALKRRGMLYHAVGHGWTCESLGYEARGWHKVQDKDIPADVRPYLAQIGGRRAFYQDTPLYSQLCYSSSFVQERLVDCVVDYAEEHPEVDYLHFWLGDNCNNFCECEKCAEKTPADWYVVLLNKLDEKLAEHGLKTRIVFLIYFELLWPPIRERLRNPDRFVMMFAPISRTYSTSYTGERYIPGQKVELPPFRLNDLHFPADLKENLSFLYANYARFSGDAFDFDYHLMWEPFKDLGGLRLAKVIWEDVRALHDLGLRGLASCQVQKVFAPHGFGLYAMGHTLEDPSVSFEMLQKEYFSAAFGEHTDAVFKALAVFDDCHCAEYLRNELSEVDEVQAQNFAHAAELLSLHSSKLDILSRGEEDKTVSLSLRILSYYCNLCSVYLEALAEKARGDRERMETIYKKMHRFLFENEQEYGKYIDSYYFDLMADQLLHSVWNVMAVNQTT